MSLEIIPLITTDGFGFYEKVVGRVFGPACAYGQVIMTRKNDRVVRVERRAVIGAGRLEQALRDSEDSVKLNTSFVERLNLTIRQGSAYLGRRTICQALWRERLEDHIELFRLLLQLHPASQGLQFGRELRTPAMQAGLTYRALTSRDFSGVEECPIRALRLGPVRQRRCLANASGGLATLDDGSTG
jgi:hypothetical protein